MFFFLHGALLHPPSFILLHDSLLYVRSFGCHPCASQSPSSPRIYLPSSFLPDDSLSPVSPVITSVHCGFVSCLSLSQPFPHFKPPITLSVSPSNLAGPVCLRFECPTLIFPTPLLLLAPPLLLLLFIYIERDGGRADRMD